MKGFWQLAPVEQVVWPVLDWYKKINLFLTAQTEGVLLLILNLMKVTAKFYQLTCKYCGIQYVGEKMNILRMNIKGRENSGCEIYICHYGCFCKIPAFSIYFRCNFFNWNISIQHVSRERLRKWNKRQCHVEKSTSMLRLLDENTSHCLHL